MEAQVHNDAKGWNDPANVVAANAEPSDPKKIWGNFTHEELSPDFGYALPVGIGHAGDYDGYTVSYREYMSRDHYRKALTSYGAHTADYMVTNLVQMAGEMNGMPRKALDTSDPVASVERARLDGMMQADEARQVAESTALGLVSGTAYDAWVASLPVDLQPSSSSRVIAQPPASVQRFSGVTFSWHGGSNAVDNPRVIVQRQEGGKWVDYADQSGEVQTMVHLPKGAQGVASVYAGAFDWQWTASFEAFDAFPRTVIPDGQTRNGTYRFVVEGTSRVAPASDSAYKVVSDEFHIGPWSGITASALTKEADGSVSFRVDPIKYPRTYASPFRFVRDDGDKRLCKTCSFRPWASTGQAVLAFVTVIRSGGAIDVVLAAPGNDGRWHAATALAPGDTASIAQGGIIDSFGEINGAAYAF